MRKEKAIFGRLEAYTFAVTLYRSPPTIEDLYSDPELEEPYPFADQLLEALQNASLRPKTPRYNDVSLAIAGTLHPMSEIDEDTYDELVANVERALAGEGLL